MVNDHVRPELCTGIRTSPVGLVHAHLQLLFLVYMCRYRKPRSSYKYIRPEMQQRHAAFKRGSSYLERYCQLIAFAYYLEQVGHGACRGAVREGLVWARPVLFVCNTVHGLPSVWHKCIVVPRKFECPYGFEDAPTRTAAMSRMQVCWAVYSLQAHAAAHHRHHYHLLWSSSPSA